MKFQAITAAVLTALLLVACGNEPPAPTPPAASQSQTSEAVSDAPNPNWKSYVVGAELNYPPFEYKDEAGRPMGFEIELLQAVAKAAEFNIQIIDIKRNTILEQLNNDQIQIGAAAMTIKPERIAEMDMSDPFSDYEPAFLTADIPENQSIQKPSDLKGKTIAVSKSSSSNVRLATELSGSANNVRTEDSFYLSVRSVLAREADVALGDTLVLKYYATQFPDSKGRVISLGEGKKELGFSVKKGNTELLNKINAGLAKVKKDGTYDKLMDKWFNKKSIILE